MYEQGFTSTSLKEESSYFKTQGCNIEIRYLIPKDSKDGISLINDELSYSTNQNEYLLDKGSLSKIVLPSAKLHAPLLYIHLIFLGIILATTSVPFVPFSPTLVKSKLVSLLTASPLKIT